MDIVSKHYDSIKKECNFEFYLKEKQKDILNHLLDEKDVFVSLPTGFGKTICLVLQPLLLDKEFPYKKHCALVISPLKALMEDQEEFLIKHNISSFILGDKLDDEKLKAAKVILTSPESINNRKWLRAVRRLKEAQISVVVYDESHCISKWGESFRPDYAQVGKIQSVFDAPVLALTATVTKLIKEDIFKIVGLDESCEVIATLPDRPNITLLNRASTEHYEEELDWIFSEVFFKSQQAPKIIIYCRNIDTCQKIYNCIVLKLNKDSYKDRTPSIENRLIEMFHSGTDNKSKNRILEKFREIDSNIRVLVCTIAFGLGVNIPNVRNVVLWGMPDSVLDFWQEIGRAGRDGQAANAYGYFYARSQMCKKCKSKCKCGEKELLRSLITEDKCQRKTILEYFAINETLKTEVNNMKNNPCESNSCHKTCTCSLCSCCIKCALQCICLSKLSINK